MNFNEIKHFDKEHIMPTYARYDIALESGKGATATGSDGKEYIDFGSGIGVNSLGYSDDGFIKAVTGQLEKIQHTSNLYYSPVQVKLAKKLCELSGCSKVFFANSGAEANECAIKLARKYSYDNYGDGRNEIITLVNSFHGRTVTTLSATGQDMFHDYFFPFTDGFKYVTANDVNDLINNISSDTCAIMIESIQGEGGVVPIDLSFALAVEEICKKRDILLICDEVQTGIGRTGKLFGFEHLLIKPDIVTCAKGLGGGLPIGACLCSEKLEEVLSATTHGTTFGGNPVVCAGAIEVLDRIANPEMLDEISKKGAYLKAQIKEMPGVTDVRGWGMMLGVTLEEHNGKEMAKQCIESGLIILTAKTLLRLLPPLTISQEEMDKGLSILKGVLENETSSQNA